MKQKEIKDKVIETALTEADIKVWLFDHPDFFEQHHDLLETLQIPHPSGEAISLVSKQLELFRNKNKLLNQQLTSLIQVAKENDALFNRMQQLTLSLMEANSVDELVNSLSTILQDYFSIDFVTFKIVTELDEKSAISDLFVSPSNSLLLPFEPILASNQPKCIQQPKEGVQSLFGSHSEKILSCAIIPLQLDRCQGLLGIGSYEENRFQPSMGNLFLDHIGELVGCRLSTLLQPINQTG